MWQIFRWLCETAVAELPVGGSAVCTKNDYNTYWPVDAAAPNKDLKLYPGITVVGHCPTMFMAKGESHMSEV